MKKLIALVLTVMMLASTIVVGISAARYAEYTPANGEPIALKDKYIACTAHGQFGISDTFGGVTDGYTFRAVLKSSTEYFENENLGEHVTYLAGSPEINMKAGTLGYNGTDEKLNYTFADETEYTIEYIVDGNTTVKVNGETVGTLSGAPRAMFYGVNYRYLVKEFAWYKDGSKFAGVIADDYNKDDVVGFFADAPVVEIETGEKVVKVVDEVDVNYIACQAHGQFGISDTFDGVTDGYTFRAVLKSSTEYFENENLGEHVTYLAGSPEINMKAGTLGYNGTSEKLSYTFADNTEYTIEYIVDGNTTVKVNGETVGTLSGAPRAMFYGVNYRYLIKEFAWYKDGSKFAGVLASDYNKDDVVGFFADAPVVVLKDQVVSYVPYVPASTINENRYNVAHAAVTSKVLDTSVSDGTYIYCGDINISAGMNVDFDVRVARDGTYSDGWGLSWLNIHTDKIGVAGNTIPFEFDPDTWYSVRYAVGSGSTEIFINGTSIGTVASQLDKFACGVEGVMFDNIVIGDKSQNFEGYDEGYDAVGNGRWYFNDGNAGGSVVKTVEITPAYTETVKKDLGEWYWTWDEDNCYAYVNGLNDKAARWEFDAMPAATTDHMGSYFGADPIIKIEKMEQQDVNYIACQAHGQFGISDTFDGVTDGYTFRAVLKSSTEYFENENLGEHVTYLEGSPEINMKAGTLGYNGTSEKLSYTFADNTEYTIEYIVDGYTTVNVNGETVGTLSGAPRAMFYGVNYRYLIKEFAWYKDGSKFAGVLASDYNKDDTVAFFADAPVIAEKVDVFSAGAIGVGSTTVEYPFQAGEWYHIVLDGSAGNGTDIYVDGALVGHVANTIKAQWCGHPSELAIDNLKITGDGVDYFEDFEDQTFGAYDGNGYAVKYTFEDVPEPEEPKDVFEFITTGTPGGEAYLVKGGYDYELGLMGADNYNAYYDMDTAINPGRSEYVINFDLALIPEDDTLGKCYFEIWSNVATNRWVVGTEFTGFYNGSENTSDYTAFDWGAATKDNFHNVTYIFRNRMVQILVDGQFRYEGRVGTGGAWTNMMIGNVYNGSAILDNVQLFKFTESNPNQPNELEALEVRMARDEDVKVIDLDAADFCAANGHIQNHTVRTTEPTCTETGVDTTYCAVCGGVAKTTSVPALGHSYPGYYSGTTVDGVRTFACRRGCGQTWSTTVPTPVAGTIDFFVDFESAEVVQSIAGIFYETDADGNRMPDGREVVEDGVGKFKAGCGQNYNQFDIHDSSLRNQYTVSFDFNYKGTFDTNDTEGYGHGVWFWFGGDSGIGNEAGYDFDRGVFFVRPWNSTAYSEYTAAVKISKDTWHHLEFKVYAPGEESEENWMKFILDGEEVLVFDEWFETTYYLPTQQSFCIIRDFGVEADIDNFAIGSIDLQLEAKINVGDLTGDTRITTKDLKLMKLALAGKIILTPAQEAAADVNGDGLFTIADLAAMKLLLAGN